MARQDGKPSGEGTAAPTKPAAKTATPPALPEDVAKKYDFVGVPGPVILSEKFGRKKVDFTKISLAEADKLAAADYPKLKKK